MIVTLYYIVKAIIQKLLKKKNYNFKIKSVKKYYLQNIKINFQVILK